MTDSDAPSPPEPITLTARMRHIVAQPVSALARGLVRLGVGPNAVTVGGFLLTIGSAWLASQGYFARAGFVYLVGTGLDGMDGAVAREGKRVTAFGALLDSTLDRYGEAAMLLALGYYMADTGNVLGVVLTIAALFGSVMVSYSRARSEGLGVDNKVGILTRVERVMVMVLTLFSGWVMVGLWILTIFTQVTVGQRMWVLHQATREHEESDHEHQSSGN